MARAANPASDFTIPVEGIGTFTFGRRRLADEIKCGIEYSRLTEGVQPDPWLEGVCTWISTLKVMTVRAPDGWNIDDLDPLDEDTYAKLFKVHAALAEKEGSFRQKPAPASEGTGAAAGAVA